MRTPWLRYLLTLLAIAVVLAGLHAGRWLTRLDDIYYDSWHQLAGKRHAAVYTTLVAVDDETLRQLRDDPMVFWGPHFASAIATMQKVGVRAIGLDYLFGVSAEGWLRKMQLPDSSVSRTYDSSFREQLASGRLVMITNLAKSSEDSLELILPPPEHTALLPLGAGNLGIANLYPDSDKTIRSFRPLILTEPNVPGASLAMQLSILGSGADSNADSWDIGGRHYAHERAIERIGFIGPPGTIPRLSMRRLLQPGAEDDPQVKALAGRVVLIAPDETGGADRHFTPYSMSLPGFGADLMTGGEIHMNIVESILSGQYPRPVSEYLRWSVIALLMVGAVAAFTKMHPLNGAIGTVIALELLLPLSYFLFVNGWIFNVAEAQAGIIVAFIGTSMQRLTGEEQERKRLRAVFGQYVSDVVVNKLLDEGQRPDMAGEEVEVTVLFSDIRSFTSMSELLQPHEVVEMLNEYFGRVCEPIFAEGGMVNKFIGDAVMAVFGAPAHMPDHALRGLQAAVNMREVAQEFRHWVATRFEGRGLPDFAIGIGVHSGSVVLGDIGSVRRKEFTVIGDTVNLASRLESLTKGYGCKILVSQDTLSRAGSSVVAGREWDATVAGKRDLVKVVEVLDVRPVAAVQGGN